MKFYTKIFSLIAPIALGAALTACDNIKDDERYIELPAVEAQRIVLLEEYTGQKCVNCPDAHVIVEGLLEQYPDNLIAVSIHGGGDAWSYDEDRYPFGLRNADGQAYTDEVGVKSFPAGVVNRNSGVKDRDQWAALIRSEIEKTTVLDLDVEATLNDDKTSIDIIVDIDPHDNLKSALQVWIVEDGIVARQQSSTGIISNYVHNNVFRGSVNGIHGETVDLVTRQPQSANYTQAVKSNWNTENLSVVAFVYNSDGVLQAAKAKVK